MLFYFLAAVCLILIVAIGRVIIDYAGSSDRLSTTVRAHQRLIDDHRNQANLFKARAKEASARIHALSEACGDVDGQIHEQLEILEQANLQLERRRPKARQVETDEEDEEDPDDPEAPESGEGKETPA